MKSSMKGRYRDSAITCYQLAQLLWYRRSARIYSCLVKIATDTTVLSTFYPIPAVQRTVLSTFTINITVVQNLNLYCVHIYIIVMMVVIIQ